jgi:hypothetical protein
LVFTRRPETVPPWNDARQLWRWRPEPTARLRRSTWRNPRGARVFRIENRRENLCIELRDSTWEAEVLRGSDGSRTLREILGRVRPGISPATLRTQLYLFYLLELLNFLPPGEQGSSARPRGSAVAPAQSRAARRRS